MKINQAKSPPIITTPAKPKGGKLYIVHERNVFLGAMTEKAYHVLLRGFPTPSTLKIEEKELNKPSAAVVAGILLGSTGSASRGGLARSSNLSKARRREIAMKANSARWGKK